jgi:predicted ATP-dependent endonuclease of OLD family
MKQRIIIKNFGPIKDVDLEINDFMVFIGPQASGKSTIAKLVYFFRSVDEFIVASLIDEFQRHEGGHFDFKRIEAAIKRGFWYLNNFVPVFDFFNEKTEIEFLFSNGLGFKLAYLKEWSTIPFFVDSNSTEISFLYVSINSLFEFFDTGFERTDNFELSIKYKEKQRRLKRDLNELFYSFYEVNRKKDNLFIPDNRNEFLDNYQKEHKLFIKGEFYNEVDDLRYYFSRVKRGRNSAQLKKVNFITELSESILKGTYHYDSEKKDILLLSEGLELKFDFASSGQKEAVWIIQYIQRALMENSSAFTIIEEPEAHLFPAAQKSLTELIALLANSAENQVMLTTHSPYILAAINNLMQAYKAGQTHPEKTNEIINKELWLDPKRVSAYFVGGEENEGKIRSIMDEELNSIAIEEIDSISEKFNSDFDKLTDLEYNVVS